MSPTVVNVVGSPVYNHSPTLSKSEALEILFAIVPMNLHPTRQPLFPINTNLNGGDDSGGGDDDFGGGGDDFGGGGDDFGGGGEEEIQVPRQSHSFPTAPRFEDDALALQAIQAMKEKLDVPQSVLECRRCGVDGAIVEKLTVHDLDHLGESKNGMLLLLNILAGNALRNKHTLESTTSELHDFARTPDGVVFAKGMTEVMPTDARTMYDLLLAEYAPKIYKYERCINAQCGNLRRCDLKDSATCSCGLQWSGRDYVRLLSVIDLLTAIFKSPPLAKAMASRKRPREEAVDEGSAPMLDFEDSSFYKDCIAGDPLFSRDPRYALIGFFLDGMQRTKSDPSSGTVKVGVVKFFNLPAWVRQMLGCTMPVVLIPPEPKIKNLQPILDVIADEVAILRGAGVEVYDSHRKEHFRLRGDLIEVAMDSKGSLEAVGRAEPGNKVGGSLGGDYRGYTLPDKIKRRTKRGKIARLNGVLYFSNWPNLPPPNAGSRYKRLRTAAASINPKAELLLEDDPPESAWSVNEEAPRPWTDAEIRGAIACLWYAETRMDLSRTQKKHLTQLAHAVGVKRVSPWIKTGLRMDRGVAYEGMHAVMNNFKAIRSLQLGYKGIFTSEKRDAHFVYEAEVNGRFVEIGQGVREGKELTTREIKDLAGYVFTIEEHNLAAARGQMVLDNNLAPRTIKGDKVFKAYRVFGIDDDRGPQFLHGAACHILCGPAGKYLTSGLAMRRFKVKDIEHTYEDVYFAMFDALNEVMRKGLSQEEAEVAARAMVEAVTLFYLAFPTFEQNHIIHQAMEIAKNAPAWMHTVWDGERVMRVVREHDHNPRDLVATVMFCLQRFSAKFFKEMTEIDDFMKHLSSIASRVTKGMLLEEDLEAAGLEIKVPNLATYLRGNVVYISIVVVTHRNRCYLIYMIDSCLQGLVKRLSHWLV